MLSSASCSFICHCHGCTCDLCKQLSRKVVEIIHNCFHWPGHDSSFGIKVKKGKCRAGFVLNVWLTDHFISHYCRDIKLWLMKLRTSSFSSFFSGNGHRAKSISKNHTLSTVHSSSVSSVTHINSTVFLRVFPLGCIGKGSRKALRLCLLHLLQKKTDGYPTGRQTPAGRP